MESSPTKVVTKVVTKAILFEDCGSTEGWEDNTNLGQAAVNAVLQSPEVQAWRAMSDEYNDLIRHIHSGGDALEFLSRRSNDAEMGEQT